MKFLTEYLTFQVKKRRYNLTQDEVYEFVLGAIENSSIQNDFKLSNHGLVLEAFDKFYKSRNE